MNVGASAPWDAGLYFSWGNIEGASADDAAAVAAMTQAAYATTPGASINRDLIGSDEDAAAAEMGIDWCMPSEEDVQELVSECDWELVSVNDIPGYRVSSKVEGNNNSIFLPMAGAILDGELIEVGVRGGYYTSTYHSNSNAYRLFLSQASHNPGNTTVRYMACNIRARLA